MGHLRKRGSKWYCVIDIGRDENGKRRLKWYSGYPTRKAAAAAMAMLENDVHRGCYVEPLRCTVGEWLERWLNNYAKQKVTGATFQGYESIITHHLKPALGHIRLDKLTTDHIQRYYGTAVESGSVKAKRGLSSTTVRQHHHVLAKALRQAVSCGHIGRNPADAAEAPKVQYHEPSWYTGEEARDLLTAAQGTDLYIPIVLALTTGMRRGEIVGLKWSDVDLDRGNLRVQRSLQQTRDGVSEKAPKSRSSRRTIALPPMTVAALRHQKAAQAERRLAKGADYDDGGWVCAAEDGRWLIPDVLSHRFGAFLAEAGLRLVRFHDLRHTHASLLLAGGSHPKVVQERLGHSSATITMDIYSHVIQSLKDEAALQCEAALSGAM